MTSHVEAGLSIHSFVRPSHSEELARLNTHFVRVLRSLEESPPPRLSRAQRRARSTHLGRLEQYRRHARFPKNRRFPGKYLPHFIDDAGTRCAMGHLIEAERRAGPGATDR